MLRFLCFLFFCSFSVLILSSPFTLLIILGMLRSANNLWIRSTIANFAYSKNLPSIFLLSKWYQITLRSVQVHNCFPPFSPKKNSLKLKSDERSYKPKFDIRTVQKYNKNVQTNLKTSLILNFISNFQTLHILNNWRGT